MKTLTNQTYLNYYQKQIENEKKELEYLENFGETLEVDDVYREDENIEDLKREIISIIYESRYIIREFDELSNYLKNHEGFYNPKYCTISPIAQRAINHLYRFIFWPSKEDERVHQSIIRKVLSPFVVNKINEYLDVENHFWMRDDVHPLRKGIRTEISEKDFCVCLSDRYKYDNEKYLHFQVEDGSLPTEPFIVHASEVKNKEYFRTIFGEYKKEGSIYIDNLYYFMRKSMYSNSGKIRTELRIIFSDLNVLPKYKGDWDYSWGSRVKKHKPTKNKFMRTDLYQYLFNENLLKISRESFTLLLKKYLFFKIAYGGKHLFSPTQYKKTYEGPYSDEVEDTYLGYCHHSWLLKERNDNGYPCSSRITVHDFEDEIDEELSPKYVKMGDDFFSCCYFLPTLLVERIKEEIDDYISSDYLNYNSFHLPPYIDTLYGFINP